MRCMIKMIWLFLPLMFVFSNAWAVDSYYLAGIGIVGQQKVAYLKLPTGGMLSIQEGDHVTIDEGEQTKIWLVKNIQSDAVIFQDPESAEFKLEFDGPLPSSEETIASQESVEEESVVEEAEIEEDVPLGYRVVETPFGTFTVKETEWLTETTTLPAPPTETAFQSAQLVEKKKVNLLAEPEVEKVVEGVETEKKIEAAEEVEEIAPGSEVIETPFGNFVVTE